MAKLKFGIFGLFRGENYIQYIIKAGGDVVALCDHRPYAISEAKKNTPSIKDIAEYDEFDEFIKADMDVVILCNYFSGHAKYAIRCMKAGKHVLSETIPNVTMAEGVALVRTVEETGKIYALLENYPYFKQNLEMKRLYEGGTLGEVVYAEGEYIHPMTPYEHTFLAPGMKHWRNWTPRTYYSTHALAPLMMITGAMPTKVTAMASFHPEVVTKSAFNSGDAAAVMICQTDKGSVFRVIGWGEFYPHGNYYRICGTRGGVETIHDTGYMSVQYGRELIPDGMEEKNVYSAKWPDSELGKIAENAGHGGGDFFVIHDYIRHIEKGETPYFDVYRSTALSSVAILGWRSCLDGNTYEIPDFRREEDRKKYENDTLSPYPDENENVTLPCSSQPHKPTAEDIEYAESVWKELDYRHD